jgi:hypothetical protein
MTTAGFAAGFFTRNRRHKDHANAATIAPATTHHNHP